jgi:Glyoxalase-like domain
MASRLYTITIDSADPARLAAFWAAALGYQHAYANDDESAIEPADDACPALLFVRNPQPKAGKNRVHLDLDPHDQAAEVRRLLDLGAVRVDIGQRDVSWVVLADPEGNEFCVLGPRVSS